MSNTTAVQKALDSYFNNLKEDRASILTIRLNKLDSKIKHGYIIDDKEFYKLSKILKII